MTPVEEFFLEKVNAGILLVSTDGKIYNSKTKNFIGKNKKQRDYDNISMKCENTNKIMCIQKHRLIWLVYIGPIDKSEYVVLKEGREVALHNLKSVCSSTYNMKNLAKVDNSKRKEAPKHYKFSLHQTADIRREYKNENITASMLAIKYATTRGTIRRLLVNPDIECGESVATLVYRYTQPLKVKPAPLPKYIRENMQKVVSDSKPKITKAAKPRVAKPKKVEPKKQYAPERVTPVKEKRAFIPRYASRLSMINGGWGHS